MIERHLVMNMRKNNNNKNLNFNTLLKNSVGCFKILDITEEHVSVILRWYRLAFSL